MAFTPPSACPWPSRLSPPALAPVRPRSLFAVRAQTSCYGGNDASILRGASRGTCDLDCNYYNPTQPHNGQLLKCGGSSASAVFTAGACMHAVVARRCSNTCGVAMLGCCNVWLEWWEFAYGNLGTLSARRVLLLLGFLCVPSHGLPAFQSFILTPYSRAATPPPAGNQFCRSPLMATGNVTTTNMPSSGTVLTASFNRNFRAAPVLLYALHNWRRPSQT